MKLKWPGFNEKGTVIIELEPETFCIAKNTLNVLGKSFIAKDEFHVTLIGTQAGLIILDKIKYNKAINQRCPRKKRLNQSTGHSSRPVR